MKILVKMLRHNVEKALKQNFLTSAFDGPEDYRVSEKLYSLVFEVMNDFRQELKSLPKLYIEKLHPMKYYHQTKESSFLVARVKKLKLMRLKHLILMMKMSI